MAGAGERIEGREVSGTEDTFADALAAGVVPRLDDVISYREWLTWRKGPGMRPTARTNEVTTSQVREAELWRDTMKNLFGEEWRIALETRETARAAEEVAEEDPYAEAVPEREPSEANSAPPTPRGYRSLLELPRDLAKETIDQYKGRVVRAATALKDLKVDLSPSGEVTLGAEMYELIMRLRTVANPADYNKFFEGELMRGLLSEDTPPTRLEAIRNLMEGHGYKMSDRANRLLSSVASSEHGTPEKKENVPKIEKKLEFDDIRTSAGAASSGLFSSTWSAALGTSLPVTGELGTSAGDDYYGGASGARQNGPATSAPRGMSGASDSLAIAEVIARAMAESNKELLVPLLKHQGNSPPKNRSSVISFDTKMKFPQLGDEGPNKGLVEDFIESFESMCALAHEGEGMSDLDKLHIIKNCLKGSKETVYQNLMRAAKGASKQLERETRQGSMKS